jgi:NAD-dependent histone deacetylase SIR2
LGLALDVLLIMGTSLRVHGLKTMVKEFAKAVHSRGGTVVFVNRTKPSESAWGDVIDYWVEMDCDQWVRDLKERRSDIWSPRSSMIEAPTKKQQSAVEYKQGSKKRSQALRDDKISGVFVTFRILDLLKKAEDAKGRQSARPDYWPSAARLSNASAIQVESKPVAKLPSKNKTTVPPAKRKSMSKLVREHPKPAKENSKPIELPPLPSNHKEYHEYHASWVSSAWENLRRQAPGLPAAPPVPQELRQPFEKFKGNLPPYLVPFSFNAVNHFPNLVTAKEKPTLGEMNMDLAHLPPKGFTIPAHTPKNTKTVVTRAINHSYSTRASRRVSNAETIVVDNRNTSTPPAVPSETEDTIVVDDPLTPSSKRIKRNCSIGNIVSSPEEGSGEEIWHDAPELPDVMT